jgi:hypothetical protein
MMLMLMMIIIIFIIITIEGARLHVLTVATNWPFVLLPGALMSMDNNGGMISTDS